MVATRTIGQWTSTKRLELRNDSRGWYGGLDERKDEFASALKDTSGKSSSINGDDGSWTAFGGSTSCGSFSAWDGDEGGMALDETSWVEELGLIFCKEGEATFDWEPLPATAVSVFFGVFAASESSSLLPNKSFAFTGDQCGGGQTRGGEEA